MKLAESIATISGSAFRCKTCNKIDDSPVAVNRAIEMQKHRRSRIPGLFKSGDGYEKNMSGS